MLVSLKWLADYIDMGGLSPAAIAEALTDSGLEVENLQDQEPGQGMMASSPQSLSNQASESTAILELKITPNRADCLGMIGIARDLSARLRRPLRAPEPRVPRSAQWTTSQHLKVTVESEESCPRFVALRVEGVKTISSPPWMQERLTASGMRPLNLIVDATNYAMLEFSQPVHAYDIRSLRGQEIQVRAARSGETLVTLDGNTRQLEAGDLLICDSQGPVGLAGIMGGQNSEVRDDTASIIIEVATFAPRQIRTTARRLGLITEASTRFERGTDRTALATVALRVAELLRLGAEYARERNPTIPLPEVAKDMVDVGTKAADPRLIAMRLSHARQFLGVTGISKTMAVETLNSLGFRFVDGTDDRLVFEVPAFRQDIEREVDLIEEVARMYGMDKIPYHMPVMSIKPTPEDPFLDFQEHVRTVLAESGLRETVTFPFSAASEYQALGLSEHHPLWPRLSLKNPLSEAYGLLQTTLIPGLLRGALANRHRGEKGVRLFECGRGYLAPTLPASQSLLWKELGRMGRHMASHTVTEKYRPTERQWVAGLMDQPWTAKQWDTKETPTTFFHGKALAEGLFKAFGIGPVSYVKPAADELPFLHPGASAVILCADKALGYMGELHPQAALSLGLGEESPVVFEFDLEALFAAKGQGLAYDHVMHRFPPITRDVALLCDKHLSYSDVRDAVSGYKERKYLQTFELFDVYVGDRVPEGKKSMAFSAEFLSPDRTLTDQEVEPEMAALVAWLEKTLGATRR